MKKTKILRIIARLNIGGPAIHTILLTQGLNRGKFESLLVSGAISREEGDMSYYASEKNINIIFIPQLKREISIFDDVIAFKKIYQIIKDENPDIIHTHTAKAGTLGRLAGIFYNISFLNNKKILLVHTFHGHVFSGYFGRFKSKVFCMFEKLLGVFTCKIITVSNSVKVELVSYGVCKSEKIEVIPLGLDLSKLANIAGKQEQDVLNIGIIGRLVPIKNHQLLLEAAKKVIRDNQGLRVKFKIIGDGELNEQLRNLSNELGILAYVDFLGWQTDLASIYSDLDIVALTSMNEGTPVSLIEAMAAGRAIVATDVGGVKDLLGREISAELKPEANFKVLERGILVKSGDSFSFSKALSFVIRSPGLRKDLSCRSKEFALSTFSKDRLIRDMESLYARILSCKL